MSVFLLSQVIAAIAFALGVISFQFKSRRSILLWISGSAIANACHFFVLDRPAAATLFLITGGRSLAAAFTVNRKIMYLFFGLILAGFLFSYQAPLGFLGLFATLLATYGSFQNTHQKVRVIFMLSATSWMVHNILVRTPVAALMEAMFLASNLVGYWRFHRSDKAVPDQGQDLTEKRPG